ncbi:MAG: undecaprenyl-diphosphate phosphatase [Clostridia bacterium]|nr:undecaprenyl-diphosphate phosphatase [Clostridia bacterium]
MKIWILLVLCLVQGLTEFLPVSSSGHLLLFENIFNIENNLLLLNLFLHLSTLVAVMVYYRKVIIKLIKKPFQPLSYKLLLSTIITVIIAFAYEILNLDKTLNKFYGYFFIATAIILTITYIFQKKSVRISVGEISYKSSIIVGVVQGIAVLPGISRSGSTISSLILSGSDEKQATEYSFLLSIPIIIGGFVLELLKIDNINNLFYGLPPIMFFVAFAVTFLISLFALKITEKIVSKNRFIYFAMYLVIVGIIAILI